MSGGRRGGAYRIAALAFGFAFLYLPIAVLVAYSFNGSRLVTIWGGLSARWYRALLENDKFRGAPLTSLEIGVMAATLALVLGTCAGLAMNRLPRFRGRLLFGFMLMAPLVVLTILFGFYPAPILDASAASVEALIKNYETAVAAAEQARIALAP